MPTYHLFKPASNPLEMIADYLLAGDGVYGVMECFGMRVPVPLLPCEIRGLPALFPWQGDSFAGGESENRLFGEEELLAPGPSYHILYEDSPTLPPVDLARIYQYVVAREGVLLLAGCTGLEVLMPISPLAELPGLASVTPFIAASYPPVGEEIVRQMLEHAKAARDEHEQPIEQLYYLQWEEGEWRLNIPEQEAYCDSVRARAITPEYEHAFLEGHSHHRYQANFSHRDDHAEVRDGGFRVYFVLGNIYSRPELRVRICIHGYEWEVPARYFFALPTGVVDCVAREWEGVS